MWLKLTHGALHHPQCDAPCGHLSSMMWSFAVIIHMVQYHWHIQHHWNNVCDTLVWLFERTNTLSGCESYCTLAFVLIIILDNLLEMEENYGTPIYHTTQNEHSDPFIMEMLFMNHEWWSPDNLWRRDLLWKTTLVHTLSLIFCSRVRHI